MTDTEGRPEGSLPVTGEAATITRARVLELQRAANIARSKADSATDPEVRVDLIMAADRAQLVADMAAHEWARVSSERDTSEAEARRQAAQAEAQRAHRKHYLESAIPGHEQLVRQRKADLESARSAVVEAVSRLVEVEASLASMRREVAELEASK